MYCIECAARFEKNGTYTTEFAPWNDWIKRNAEIKRKTEESKDCDATKKRSEKRSKTDPYHNLFDSSGESEVGSDISAITFNGDSDENEEESGKTSGKKEKRGHASATIGEEAFMRRSHRIQENNERRIDFGGRKQFLDCAHQNREKAKDDKTKSAGLLVGRKDYQTSHGVLLSGELEDCLADAVAMALGFPQAKVRDFIGLDHTFIRAAECVRELQPGSDLVPVTQSYMKPGGIELALLSAHVGVFILRMSYTHEGETSKQHHCAIFDAGYLWKRETVERGWIEGRGVLKDNQTDVLVHLAEASEGINTVSDRSFFQFPYKCRVRIEAVYELVRKSERGV
jgi:hypothetical protein